MPSKTFHWRKPVLITGLLLLTSSHSLQAQESCAPTEEELINQCAQGKTQQWPTACWNKALTALDRLPVTENLNACRKRFGLGLRKAEVVKPPPSAVPATPVSVAPAVVPVPSNLPQYAPKPPVTIKGNTTIQSRQENIAAIAIGRSNTAANSAGAIPGRIQPKRAIVFDDGLGTYMPPPRPMTPLLAENTERYGKLETNPVIRTAEQPVSTFSIDVDTGSYTNVRRMLNAGVLPPDNAVRVEEMLNYFPYSDTPPATGTQPFAAHYEIAPSPWKAGNWLLRVALKAKTLPVSAIPPANLVFLVDVSGSMNPAERLPLVKSSLKLLVEKLRPQDKVSLVTYASGTRVALAPTEGKNKAEILAAIDGLNAGGGTYGSAGIQLAYAMAEQGFVKEGINRILLATDGDFNVGTTNFEALKTLIQEKRKTGVALTTLGFGVGNYNEHLMEQLADAGNGQYAYIDTLSEGQKVLVEELSSTLATVAADVKAQIEFNPAVVQEYRQIGYENRALARADFKNDKVDAGEIGYDHGVTILYELTPVGQSGMIDPLRYGSKNDTASAGKQGEIGFLRLRYKQPGAESSQESSQTLLQGKVQGKLRNSSEDFRFSAAVAAFGQWLRHSPHLGNFGPDEILALARPARGKDEHGYRSEFVKLVELAKTLASNSPKSEAR
jgi:Ca-activated chloride channel family protein